MSNYDSNRRRTVGTKDDFADSSQPGQVNEEFKAHEKRALISHFLHNDEVFKFLCQKMFK